MVPVQTLEERPLPEFCQTATWQHHCRSPPAHKQHLLSWHHTQSLTSIRILFFLFLIHFALFCTHPTRAIALLNFLQFPFPRKESGSFYVMDLQIRPEL